MPGSHFFLPEMDFLRLVKAMGGCVWPWRASENHPNSSGHLQRVRVGSPPMKILRGFWNRGYHRYHRSTCTYFLAYNSFAGPVISWTECLFSFICDKNWSWSHRFPLLPYIKSNNHIRKSKIYLNVGIGNIGICLIVNQTIRPSRLVLLTLMAELFLCETIGIHYGTFFIQSMYSVIELLLSAFHVYTWLGNANAQSHLVQWSRGLVVQSDHTPSFNS